MGLFVRNQTIFVEISIFAGINSLIIFVHMILARHIALLFGYGKVVCNISNFVELLSCFFSCNRSNFRNLSFPSMKFSLANFVVAYKINLHVTSSENVREQ